MLAGYFIGLIVEAFVNKKSVSIFLVLVLSLSALLLNFKIVFAHESVTAGNYTIEVGWTEEPPIVGQRNAIVVNISDSSSAEAEIDISTLVVEVSYGGQTKTLTLQPLSEETKNQYVAPILPSVPGKYTVKLSGSLGATAIANSVDVEEVEGADLLSFPSVPAEKPAQSSALGLSAWLAIAALVVGLAGLVLGFLAFQKTR